MSRDDQMLSCPWATEAYLSWWKWEHSWDFQTRCTFKCPKLTLGKNDSQCQTFSPLAPLTPQIHSQKETNNALPSQPAMGEIPGHVVLHTQSTWTREARFSSSLSCHSPQILPWNVLVLLFHSETEGSLALHLKNKEWGEGERKSPIWKEAVFFVWIQSSLKQAINAFLFVSCLRECDLPSTGDSPSAVEPLLQYKFTKTMNWPSKSTNSFFLAITWSPKYFFTLHLRFYFLDAISKKRLASDCLLNWSCLC